MRRGGFAWVYIAISLAKSICLEAALEPCVGSVMRVCAGRSPPHELCLSSFIWILLFPLLLPAGLAETSGSVLPVPSPGTSAPASQPPSPDLMVTERGWVGQGIPTGLGLRSWISPSAQQAPPTERCLGVQPTLEMQGARTWPYSGDTKCLGVWTGSSVNRCVYACARSEGLARNRPNLCPSFGLNSP